MPQILLSLTLLLAWSSFALLISLFLSIVQIPIFARLNTLAPTPRAWLLWVFASAPLLVGALFTGLTLFPSFVSLFLPAFDHCTSHGNHHLHLCLTHWNLQRAPIWFWITGLSPVALAFTWFAPPLWRSLRAQRLLSSLTRTAILNEATGSFVIEHPKPIAFVHGLLRQQIVISSSLLNSLDQSSLAVVIAHERAHLQRHDNLFKFSAQLLSIPYPPHVRGPLLSALSLSCEQACDEQASTSLGRLHVAQVLLKVERQCHQAPAPFATSQIATLIEARVVSLLSPTLPQLKPNTIKMLLVLLVLGLISLSDPLHHLSESMLGWLLRS